MPVLAAALLLAAISNPPPSYGAQLYRTYCATCHAVNFEGTADGPPLRGVGTAAVDFYLTTGRMPAAEPWMQVDHRGARLNPGDIAAIEAYLAPLAGPPAMSIAGPATIPTVIAGGDLERGRALYTLNCLHCHGATGDGGALGGLHWVPGLHQATITQVAEAIRVGPGEMPRFGDHQLTQNDLDDVASYVTTFRTGGQPPVVPPFRSTGPLPEGAVGWMAIIILVMFVFTYWRSGTPPREREEAVRREAGEESEA